MVQVIVIETLATVFYTFETRCKRELLSLRKQLRMSTSNIESCRLNMIIKEYDK